MDACHQVDTQIDRILSKFSGYTDCFNRSLGDAIASLTKLREELLIGPDVNPEDNINGAISYLWEKELEKVKNILNQMSTEHREMHGGVSKCGREIDKNFIGDFTNVCQKAQHYESDPTLKPHVNNLVAKHLLTKGLLDVADFFSQESGVNLGYNNKELYVQINSVLNALKDRNLEPALQWVTSNSERLAQFGSTLEFNLCKFKFIELLSRGKENEMETVAFSRVFEKFVDKHVREIQVLMGCLLFLPKGLENSPYKSILDPIQWAQLCDMFVKDACTLLGLSAKSPLSVLLNAGTIAFPALLNIRQVMQQRQVMGMWGHNDELPIEIDLGNENRFHSIFSCPILRQQTTEKNPPMRLTCGHCISKEALHKLASNNKYKRSKVECLKRSMQIYVKNYPGVNFTVCSLQSKLTPLKCPYCPQESIVNDVKVVFF